MSGSENFRIPIDVDATLWWLAALLVAMVALYAARPYVHQAVTTATRLVLNALRFTIAALKQTHRRVRERNRQVLLEAARRGAERATEREFQRLDHLVQSELATWPTLERKINTALNQMQDDYRSSTELPPPAPAWVDALDSVARIKPGGDPVVADVLRNIKASLDTAHTKALNEYHEANQKRHGFLTRLLPHWRLVALSVLETDKRHKHLQARARAIDTRVARFEEIVNATDETVGRLSASAFQQFVLSALLLGVGFGVAFLDFRLIVHPFAGVVGEGAVLAGVPVPDLAAGFLVAAQIALGLFLMEALCVTGLFSAIEALEHRMRERMKWVALALLVTLAAASAAINYVHVDLNSARAGASPFSVIGAVLLSCVLPFLLAFFALPLEAFMRSSRTVAGAVVEAVLSLGIFSLHQLCLAARGIGYLVIQLYDLAAFAPLWIDGWIRTRQLRRQKEEFFVEDPESNKLSSIERAL